MKSGIPKNPAVKIAAQDAKMWIAGRKKEIFSNVLSHQDSEENSRGTPRGGVYVDVYMITYVPSGKLT